MKPFAMGPGALISLWILAWMREGPQNRASGKTWGNPLMMTNEYIVDRLGNFAKLSASSYLNALTIA